MKFHAQHSLAFSIAFVFAFVLVRFAAAAQSPGPDSITAQDFVTQAALSDMYEVQAGKLAQTKAQSAAVKSFARRMVTAHSRTTADLKRTIARAKIDVTPPSQLDQKHETMIDQLKGAGQDFDTMYIGQQESAHQQALKLMQDYASNGDNRALKQFAQRTVPIIQDHLSMIRKLEPKESAR